MMKITYFYMFLFPCFVFFTYSSTHGYDSKLKHYIVYMGHHTFSDSESLIIANYKLLASYVGSVKHARSKVVHHYHKNLRGFSALLTPKEANMLRIHSSVISVFESQVYKLQTTRTWNFLLEHHRDNPKADVVIGHLDSGIWPELANFNPSNLGLPPSYYKSACYPGFDKSGLSSCNNKIVGFRFYNSGYQNSSGSHIINDKQLYASARDDYGHGTHTASIALGTELNYDGYGISGTVKGGAPYARLAVYKTCWHDFCDGADILKAFDDAISDNVDVITPSLGSNAKHPPPYSQDALAIGSLHAFLAGKLVVACAGNNGEYGAGTVFNAAPWVLTVAATSVDRDLVSNVVLGNGKVLKGYGYNVNDLSNHGIVMADEQFSNCNGDLGKSRVSEKIVVCFMGKNELLELGDFVERKSSNVQRGGGVGMILVSYNQNQDGILSYLNQIPTSVIEFSDFQVLQQYINSTNGNYSVEPTARISRSMETIRNRRAPNVAAYSGRGPNILTPDIIKPDIAAPGSGILAGWPSDVPPPPNQPVPKPPNRYPNQRWFAFASGTSMACPHISGVASVLLSFLKSSKICWTPATLKSALMTSATYWDNTRNYTQNGKGELASPFDFGSGHVVPDLIFNPGLVYDMPINDLQKFLCTQYGNCSTTHPFPAYNLNYPSIAINGLTKKPVSVIRKVSRVEEENNPYTYRAILSFPKCVHVVVFPTTLNFTPQNHTIAYTATFANLGCSKNAYGSITWTDDGKHFVKTNVALIIA